MNRLKSLDVFRGIAIVMMVLVNNPGSWATIYWPLKHAQWHGLTPTDVVFPLFIFAMGASLALSVRRQLGSERTAIIPGILRRSAILFACGLFLALFFYNPYSSEFNWFADRFMNVRVMGVLQRLALVYLLTALLVLYVPARQYIVWCIGLLLLYWAMMTFIPYHGNDGEVYQGLWLFGNSFAAWLDANVLGVHHVYYGGATPFPFDPEGLLSTLPAVASCLFGVIGGNWLQQSQVNGAGRKSLWLPAIATLVLGLVAVLWIPVNKALWSPSFVLITAGLSMLLLALLEVALNRSGKHVWTKPFLIAGCNSLFFFMLSGIVARLLFMIPVHGKPLKSYFFEQYFLSHFSPYNASLVFAICFLLVMFIPTWWLYKKRWFIRV